MQVRDDGRGFLVWVSRRPFNFGKRAVGFLVFLALVPQGLLPVQQSDDTDACKFRLADSKVEPPHVTGPENLIPLVHVMKQPDSPLEIRSVDFTNTLFSLQSDMKYVWHPQYKVTVRNRGDRTIRSVEVFVGVRDARGGVGGGIRKTILLAPGQEAEISGNRVRGSGGAEGGQVAILVGVEWVDIGGCWYRPSVSVPRSWQVARP
jgi:hypothetical protein